MRETTRLLRDLVSIPSVNQPDSLRRALERDICVSLVPM